MENKIKNIIAIVILIMLIAVSIFAVYYKYIDEETNKFDYDKYIDEETENTFDWTRPCRFKIEIDKKIFNFKNIIEEDGGIKQNKTIEATMNIINEDNIDLKELTFDLEKIPPDLYNWACEIGIKQSNLTHMLLFTENGITKTDDCWYGTIKENQSKKFTFYIRMIETEPYSFKNNMSYNLILLIKQEYFDCYMGSKAMKIKTHEIPLKVIT
ncbi:MAG: hypothetical protein KGY67_00405 [Candidatus Thermoplasmatota archaeon]|nr:hypothetical protein [Candidatus Thermoplasmatota archaeon]